MSWYVLVTSLSRRGLTFQLGILARNVDEVGARIGFGFGVCGKYSIASTFSHLHTQTRLGIMALFGSPVLIDSQCRLLTLSHSTTYFWSTSNWPASMATCYLVCRGQYDFITVAKIDHQALTSPLDIDTSERHFHLGSSQVCRPAKKVMESVIQLNRKKIVLYRISIPVWRYEQSRSWYDPSNAEH